jgi:acetate kinase
MKILVLNAGSSSQKSCLYEVGDRLPSTVPEPLWEGSVDWTHKPDAAEIKVKTHTGVVQQQETAKNSRMETITNLLQTLWQGDTRVVGSPDEISAVGHRVVHGGEDYRDSVPVTAAVKEAIARLANFAPVHNPVNLEGIEAIETILGPSVPQVAVFDTAFHSTLPAAAYIYPGPWEWAENGIRRYGFHGTSHQYCAQRAAQMLGQNLQDLRVITCHLGNGCSLAAVRNGQCIDTTMGFTPLEGLMMGTRSGSIDPGILIHLMRQHGYDAGQLDHLLNKESGLKGVSRVSGDLRQVMAAIDAGNHQAKLALEVYIHSLRSHLGAMLASLGGLDVLVFTAGVGENSPPIRAGACEPFTFLGLHLDPAKNVRSPDDIEISTADSRVRVLVIHTQEDWAIARECWRVLGEQNRP